MSSGDGFRRTVMPGLFLLVAGAAACQSETDSVTPQSSQTGVLEVTARGLNFEAPAEIPSGWTTVRLKNEDPVLHFALIDKLPPGKTIEDSRAEVMPVFADGMDLLMQGRNEAAIARFGDLPEWFNQVVFLGGPGLTAGGRTSEVVVNLEPGTYVLECYVKTAEGKFHPMAHQVIVTDEPSGAPAPNPTWELTVRNSGIELSGEPGPGDHTIAVHFAEQQVHGNFVGSDVHLVRLRSDTDISDLYGWMNWMQPLGLVDTLSADFLGGMHEMPAGQTGYINVALEPGRYAWIAEVDDPAAKNMVATFVVPAPSP